MNLKLKNHLKAIAQKPLLLVATDYDGTIAPIVSNPRKAAPHREALIALKNLAQLSHTDVAIISGRSLQELTRFTGEENSIRLIGSHGSEFELGYVSELSTEKIGIRNRILEEIKNIIGKKRGFLIEEKPAGGSLHYRNARAPDVSRILPQVEEVLQKSDSIFIRHGKKVIEFSTVSTNKGDALEKIRSQIGASAVIFIGDDRTDEDAFEVLRGPDLSVKVGPGETKAEFRIADTKAVAQLLAFLSEERSKWLRGSAAVPIQEHSLLSDLRTTALVTPNGRITWWCVPRIDSGALFAEIIGGPSAGYFSISSVDNKPPVKQFYKKSTLCLETHWENFRLLDYLDVSGGRAYQRAGRSDLIRVIEGSGKVKIEFSPRLDFGRVSTRLQLKKNGIEIEDTIDPIVLMSPGVPWALKTEGIHQKAEAVVDLNKIKSLRLELRFGTGNLGDSPVSLEQRQLQTEKFWEAWAGNLELPALPSHVRKQVIRSALTLKALCYGPSGAISAAATTSLPETVGGIRNWDYRFCWLRDAALSAQALVELGSISEAMFYLDWVLDIVDKIEQPERLRPLYTVTGASVMAEAEISELSGYRASRPVRVGNAAAQQVQLDVFGPIVDLIWQLSERGAPLSSHHWRLVEAMVFAVKNRWQEADHGIWEIRAARQHHTHSKVMCWLSIDRAVKLSDKFLGKQNPEWIKLRSEIAADILSHSWNEKIQAFTSAYGSESLDASSLFVGLSGLIPKKDKRFAQTIRAVEKVLRRNNIVYRYLSEDGLPGQEAGFLLCSSWLIESYLLVGRKKDALELFEAFIKMTGNTGLLSEEFCENEQTGLGNHPQAYSHLGLILSALRLAEAGLFKKL